MIGGDRGRLATLSVSAAAARLLAGGVVAIPTDTVYGIAASLRHPAALQRIYAIKGRDERNPLPVLVADASFVARLTTSTDSTLAELAARHWPGPLTLVVPARHDLPGEVLGRNEAGEPTVGLRMPDHAQALAIIAAAGGALAVTSANRSGEPPAVTTEEVQAQLGQTIDGVVDSGPAPGGVPSTVVAVDGDRLVILRHGAVDAARLLARE